MAEAAQQAGTAVQAGRQKVLPRPIALLPASKTIAYRGECKTFRWGKIRGMILAVMAIRFLEALFFLGLAGSAIVVLVSFIEDGRELVGKD